MSRASLALALGGFLTLSQAWALAPEIETDRLILAAEERLQNQDFTAAREFLERIPALKVVPPVKYYFLNGKTLFETGGKTNARADLERYVEKAGRDGEFYQEALKMLTAIEQAEAEAKHSEKAQVAAQATAAAAAATSVSGDERQGEAYDRRMQQLYLGVPLKDALVTHINSLLRTYMYLEGKVKNVERSDRVQYSLAVRGRGDVAITETKRMQTATGPQNAINVLPLNAFGVSPFVEYRCSKTVDSCYIKNPADGADWLRVAYDEAGARELALAFERLIKAIQRG